MHTQLREKLNESFELISSLVTGWTFIMVKKNRKKIGHRESISKLSVPIPSRRRMDGIAPGNQVGNASATESLLRFSILLVTNLSSTLCEKAIEAVKPG